MNVIKPFQHYIDKQYGCPTGMIGSVIGEKMVRQHKPETHWTIKEINIQQNETILELGCGAGYAIDLLQRESSVHHVTGIDLSFSVLTRAKIRNQRAIDSGKVSLIYGNVNLLPLQNDSITKVFSIHSVYFWEEISLTVNEIYRVLKPEGTVMLTLCDGKDYRKWESITEKIEGEIIPSMIHAGFTNVDLIEGPQSRGYHTLAVKGKK